MSLLAPTRRPVYGIVVVESAPPCSLATHISWGFASDLWANRNYINTVPLSSRGFSGSQYSICNFYIQSVFHLG